MEATLLATKVQIPPQPHYLVHRPRLVDRLEQQIPHYKLVLLAATAGYGKTTLLSQWADSSRYPIAWLSLSQEDNDPERFLRYLFAAWERTQPGIQESRLGILLESSLPDMDAVLSAFINLATELSEQTVFVLDDYHLIDDPAIHETVISLLDHLPPVLHFVLAARGEPLLPLARYRARGQLLEMRADDLLFAPEETTEFLQHKMGLDVASDDVASVQAQVEGWAAGLQLAALSLQRLRDKTSGKTDALTVSGRHRYIADYLSEDVLVHLPNDLRRFLLQTSILERLCASLCDAVTGFDSNFFTAISGNDEKKYESKMKNGQALLERLERENLFLVALDENREWFRYHQLFADFLREELNKRNPDEVRTLHRRAAHWHFEHDLPEPSLQHAVAGDDVELALQIFYRYGTEKLDTGEFRVLERWLDSLPEAWRSEYPAFSLTQAGLYAYTGSLEACVQCVNEVEAQLTPVADEMERQQLARVTAIRCFMACMQNDLVQAESFAARAFQELPEEDLDFRPRIYVALGDSYRQHGYWEKAKEIYRKSLDFIHVPALRVYAAHVFGALADLELRQGHLQAAAGYWRRALASIQDRESWGRLSLPVTGWVYTRMGELLYEWNEVAEAGAHVLRGLERAEVGGDVRTLIVGNVILARLKLSQGEIDGAAAYLEQARPLVEEAAFAYWTSRFERCQLELWLAQDRLRTAVNWADAMIE